MSFYQPMPPPADDVAPRGTKEWRRAVDARRRWTANELWSQQHYNQLDLSNPDAMSRALAGMGITDEIGGGRHARRLFMGDLPSEGFGMSNVPGRGGMSYAMERYMPDWKFNLDRSIQAGTPRLEANERFIPGAGLGASSSFPAGSFPGSPGPAPSPGLPPTGFGASSAGAAPLQTDEDWLKKRNTLGSLGLGD